MNVNNEANWIWLEFCCDNGWPFVHGMQKLTTGSECDCLDHSLCNGVLMVGIGTIIINNLSCSNDCVLEETGVECAVVCVVTFNGDTV